MRSETFSLKNVLHANKYLKRHDAALTYKSEHKVALKQMYLKKIGCYAMSHDNSQLFCFRTQCI